MFKISFSSLGNPNMRLERFADLLGRCGYDAIALRGRPDHHVHWQDDAERRAEVRSTLADNGLGVSSIATYVFVATRDSGGPERSDTRNEQENIEEVLRWMDLAEDLGAETVRVFGGALTPGETHEDAIPRIARIMDAAAAEHPDVNVAIELHDVWKSAALVARILSQTHHPNCKVVWDIGATESAGESPADVVAALGPERIAYVQVMDKFPLMDGKPYHCLLGAGDTPVQQVMAALASAGWSGYLDAEYEAHYNEYMPEVEVAIPQTIMKLRQWMKTMSSDE